ncbi:unnamed protein product [Allacma fusca]|uniref:Uncharacterized protein n=1 Tax=Allacma fusca TaxID=39272 RepID=A0A8J2JK73_9HEXA|nr:unnamed protein product [Allacma fusca]
MKKNKSDLRLPPEIQTFPVIGTLRLFLSNNVLSDFLEIAKNYEPVARTVIGTKQ